MRPVDKYWLKAIYYTNVMLCIAEHFAAICLESISNEEECKLVSESLTESGHQIVDISFEQMYRFAWNMLGLEFNNGRAGHFYRCLKVHLQV